MESEWETLASEESLNKTIDALKANGIEVIYAENKEDAKEKVLSLIPKGVEIMTMTSVTLDTLGLSEILNSGEYYSVRVKLNSMDKSAEKSEMNKLGAGPDYVVGSIHAITEDGKVVVASNTGSQLPAYVYGAGKVVWIAGTHKIVKDLDEAFKRVYGHSLPLESERAKKAYGIEGSAVNKLLIVNNEVTPKRIFLVLVGEVLGY